MSPPIARRDSSRTSLDGALDRLDPRPESSVAAIPTGFRDLDLLTGGLRSGAIVVIASRPSMGRTTLALNIAQHLSMVGWKRVAVFCDAAGTAVEQILASLTGLPRGAIHHGSLDQDASAQLAAAATQLRAGTLMVDDTASLTSSEIAERTLALVEKSGGSLDAIVIDLEDPSWGRGSRKEAIAETERAMSTLKAVAAQVGAVVAVTTRLSRRPEHRQDPCPRLTDMRHRDLPLLRAADVVLLLYRDDIYNLRSNQKGLAQVIVAKNRFGREGCVLLRCQFEYGRFCDHPNQDDPNRS